MPSVELIYDMDCPNVSEARKALLKGFVEAGLQPSWAEWDRKSPESPFHVRLYGSPTILVDGRDVGGAEPADGSDCCRIYDHGARGLRGVPSNEQVIVALEGRSSPAHRAKMGRGWWQSILSLPGVGAALLPIGVCPACWPAYAGILGALGLGFLFESEYLIPITVLLLGLALFALAFRARTRKGYGPFFLGIISVSFVLVFKFAYISTLFEYIGLLGLIVASFWNAWPEKRDETGFCPNCAPQELAIETKNTH